VSISFASRIRAPEDVLASELDGEAVLLKLQSESYFGLDEIGTRMWQLLLSSDSVQAAYDALLTEFDVEPDVLRVSMTELLDNLLQQGLIEIVPG
jgi:hypothetical protein